MQKKESLEYAVASPIPARLGAVSDLSIGFGEDPDWSALSRSVGFDQNSLLFRTFNASHSPIK